MAVDASVSGNDMDEVCHCGNVDSRTASKPPVMELIDLDSAVGQSDLPDSAVGQSDLPESGVGLSDLPDSTSAIVSESGVCSTTVDFPSVEPFSPDISR